jgi:hypothetical protein
MTPPSSVRGCKAGGEGAGVQRPCAAGWSAGEYRAACDAKGVARGV